MNDALRLARAEARADWAMAQHDKDSALIQYLSMMTDTPIPEETENNDGTFTEV